MSNKQSDNLTSISSDQATQPATTSTEDLVVKALNEHVKLMTPVIIKVLSGGTEEEKREGDRMRKSLEEMKKRMSK
jgi:hypothetical protein